MITTFNDIVKVDGDSGIAGQVYGLDINNLFDITDALIEDTATADISSAVASYSRIAVVGGTSNAVTLVGKGLPPLSTDTFEISFSPLFTSIAGGATLSINGVSAPILNEDTSPLTSGDLILGTEVRCVYSVVNDVFTLFKTTHDVATVGGNGPVITGAVETNSNIINLSIGSVVEDTSTDANSVVTVNGLTLNTSIEATLLDRSNGDICKIHFTQGKVYVASNNTDASTSIFADMSVSYNNGKLDIIKNNTTVKFGSLLLIFNKVISSDTIASSISVTFSDSTPASQQLIDVRGILPSNTSIPYAYYEFLPKDILPAELDTELTAPLLHVLANLDSSTSKHYLVYNIRVGTAVTQLAIDMLEPYNRFTRTSASPSLDGIVWSQNSTFDQTALDAIIGDTASTTAYDTTKKLHDLIASLPSAGAVHPLNGGVAQSLVVPSVPLAYNDSASIGYAKDTYVDTSYSAADITVTNLHGTPLISRLLKTNIVYSDNAGYINKFARTQGAVAPGPDQWFTTSYFKDDFNGFQTTMNLIPRANADEQKCYVRFFSGDGVNPMVFDAWSILDKYQRYSANIEDSQYTVSNGRFKSNMSNGVDTIIFEENINPRELQIPLMTYRAMSDGDYVCINHVSIGAGQGLENTIGRNGNSTRPPSVQLCHGSVISQTFKSYPVYMNNRTVFQINLDTDEVMSNTGQTTFLDYKTNGQVLGSPYTLGAVNVGTTTQGGIYLNDKFYANTTSKTLNCSQSTPTVGGALNHTYLYTPTNDPTGRVKYMCGDSLATVAQTGNGTLFGMQHQYDTVVTSNLNGMRLSTYQWAGGVHLTQVTSKTGDRMGSGRGPWEPYFPYLGGATTTAHAFVVSINSTHVSRNVNGGLFYYSASDNRLKTIGRQKFPLDGVKYGPARDMTSFLNKGRIQFFSGFWLGAIMYSGKQWIRIGDNNNIGFAGSTSGIYTIDTNINNYIDSYTKTVLVDSVPCNLINV